MKTTGVRVEFSKRLNDGDYGHEQVNIQYVVELEEGEDPQKAVALLLRQGRERAIAELGDSENSRVRWKLEPPKASAALDMEQPMLDLRSGVVLLDDGDEPPAGWGHPDGDDDEEAEHAEEVPF